MIQHLPVFAICGYSGSGKTTLIVGLIKQLSAAGLKVGALKHDAHGLNIDHEGKDSDRFFKAGADVMMIGPDQTFLRGRRGTEFDLETGLNLFGQQFDLVLIEGYKSTPFVDKVWVLKEEGEVCPPEVDNVRRVLGRDEDRVGIVMDLLRGWLAEKLLALPVYAGVLIGGQSFRMGRPKHLIINSAGQTWLEMIVASVRSFVKQAVILGRGEIPESLEDLPRLSDIEDDPASLPGQARGPLAGILSAMRWRPDVSWLFLSCDMPQVSADALRWLLASRNPGVWAVLPRRAESGNVEPLPGWYDFRSRHLLEKCRGPAGIAGHAQVVTPVIPAELLSAWTNVNTMRELEKINSFAK